MTFAFIRNGKGTINGVVTSKVSTWNAWGELKGVDYTDGSTDDGELKGVDYSDGSASTVAVTKEKPVSRLLKRTSPMMRGDDVRALQESLNKLGYNCGAVDGIFGDKTKAGVIAFQTAAGVKVDGIVGPITQGALSNAIASNSNTSTGADNET